MSVLLYESTKVPVVIDRIPIRVRPMLAHLVPVPFHRPGWVFEEKYDGIRILAYKEGAKVTLLSRNDLDRTATFTDIASAVGKLQDRTLLLDGLSGSACEGKFHAHARISLNSLKCPISERRVGGWCSLLRTPLRRRAVYTLRQFIKNGPRAPAVYKLPPEVTASGDKNAKDEWGLMRGKNDQGFSSSSSFLAVTSTD
jgi:hypothetical protein